MSSHPDISVVMSVYNGAVRLNETMESILSQDGVSLEFIIIDDGSTDGSDVILDGYARRDARVTILHQNNQGLTRALITGCKVAKGQYIARQDAGDIAMPNRLRLQKEVLDQNADCIFVSCWTSVIGPKNECLFTIKGTGRASSPIQILSKDGGLIDGPTHHGSVMFRAGGYVKAGGYRPAFYYAQDWDLWYRLAELGNFTMVEQCLLQGRITPESISSLNRDRQVEYARLSSKAFSYRLSGHSDTEVLQEAERLPHHSRAVRRSAQGRAMYFIGRCLYKNNDPRATRYLLSAIFLNPFLLRAWWWVATSLARHRSLKAVLINQ
jgi:glycosyltransferase involved in cell wall biosynthesis